MARISCHGSPSLLAFPVFGRFVLFFVVRGILSFVSSAMVLHWFGGDLSCMFFCLLLSISFPLMFYWSLLLLFFNCPLFLF